MLDCGRRCPVFRYVFHDPRPLLPSCCPLFAHPHVNTVVAYKNPVFIPNLLRASALRNRPNSRNVLPLSL